MNTIINVIRITCTNQNKKELKHSSLAYAMAILINLERLQDYMATVDAFCSRMESFKSIKIYTMSTATFCRKYCQDMISISYYET